MNAIRGIKGVTGRTPIGAAISISRRDRAGGPPRHKDGFWIMNTHQTDGKREMHPAYAFFNQASVSDRQILHGAIVHAEENQCFEHHRKAQNIGGPMHPHKAPHCIGDGVVARRWNFKDPDVFVDIECLGNKCEFAQGENPPCKPWLRFVILITHWRNGESMPGVLAKFTSQGWDTYRNFLGFFDFAREAANNMALTKTSLFGLPVTLHHTIKTKPEKRRRYQVIEIHPRKDPVTFFAEQAKRIKAIRAEYGELEAITDRSQIEPEIVYEDQKSIDWPRSKSN